MIKLIVGEKGTGKTKAMIDMINAVADTTNGNVVVVEKSMKLTYDISHKARLIDVDEYKITNYDALYGFLAGLLAGNYDITDVFVDGSLKIGGYDLEGYGVLLDQVNALAGENVKVTITVSANAETLPESVKKYMA